MCSTFVTRKVEPFLENGAVIHFVIHVLLVELIQGLVSDSFIHVVHVDLIFSLVCNYREIV